MTDAIRAYLSVPQYGGEPTPEARLVLNAYAAELGTELPDTWPNFVHAIQWWNAGAPELYKGPTAGSESLAHYRAAVAAGTDEGDPEYQAILTHQDREERLARVLPSPERPGWRAPRSKYAP